MKTFISKNQFGIWTINVPLFNNELSLFIERLQILQGTLPQFSPTFKDIEFNDEKYTSIYLFNTGSNTFAKKDVMQILYSYIKANI